VPPPRAGSGRLPGGACIPPLLENWKHKVLLAGKYLNVIRECGIEVQKVTKLHDDDLAMDDERSVPALYIIPIAYTQSKLNKLLQIY
jgi:gamma-tubulin complex component 2